MGHCYLRLSAMQCIVIAQIVGGRCAKGGKRLLGSLSPDPASYQQIDSKSLYWDLFGSYFPPKKWRQAWQKSAKGKWLTLHLESVLGNQVKGTLYWRNGPVTIISTPFQMPLNQPIFESLLWITCSTAASTATHPLNACPLLHPPILAITSMHLRMSIADIFSSFSTIHIWFWVSWEVMVTRCKE